MPETVLGLPAVSIVLTLGAYQVGLACSKRWKHPLCNPLLISVVLVMGLLLLTGASIPVYREHMQRINWLMTPATVSLAVPMYGQMRVLKKHLPAVLGGIGAGVVTSLVVVLLLCLGFGLDRQVTISLLPKSITTAIGMVVSEENGGIPALTSVVIILTGILGSVTGPMLCRLLRLNHPVAQGVAFGTAAHVIGTSRATELGSLQGGVSSLSLTVAGIVTAVIFPLVCRLVP